MLPDKNWWKMSKLKDSNETFFDDFQTMCSNDVLWLETNKTENCLFIE